MDLRVNLAKESKFELQLQNPVMTGSGTFSNGLELAKKFNINELGAVVSKGTTIHPRKGNATPRTHETASGMINAIGFQNIGVSALINNVAPIWEKWNIPTIVNIMGDTISDYGLLSEKLDNVAGISALEVNISCPNVDAGGLEYGQDPLMAAEVISVVRNHTSLPIIAKLTPSVSNIHPIVEAVTQAGSQAITISNTIPALAIDINSRQPVIANGFGGLSGPAIKPIILRLVWQAASISRIPIIASGGIISGKDAIEFIMAGASAVQVGTATFLDPFAPWRIIDEIENWCTENKIQSISELVGAAQNVH